MRQSGVLLAEEGAQLLHGPIRPLFWNPMTRPLFQSRLPKRASPKSQSSAVAFQIPTGPSFQPTPVSGIRIRNQLLIDDLGIVIIFKVVIME
jgi:hypothetical protein